MQVIIVLKLSITRVMHASIDIWDILKFLQVKGGDNIIKSVETCEKLSTN